MRTDLLDRSPSPILAEPPKDCDGYDVVVFSRDENETDEDKLIAQQEEALSFLRKYTPEEDAKALERFPDKKLNVWIAINSPRGGWDPCLYHRKIRALCDKITICRLYRMTPESVPNDYNWYRIKENLFGGIFINKKQRL